MEYYRFYSYSAEQRESVRIALLEQIKHWQERWFTNASVSLTVVDASEKEAVIADDKQNISRQGRDFKLVPGALSYSRLYQHLFHCTDSDNKVASSLTTPVIQQCLDDLLRQMDLHHDAQCDVLKDNVHRKLWSGWLIAAININEDTFFELVLSPDFLSKSLLIETQSDNAKALDARADSVSNLPIQLKAELGSVSLPVKEIISLKPGDIILFEQNIADGVTLKNSQGTTVARGDLCDRDGLYSLMLKA